MTFYRHQVVREEVFTETVVTARILTILTENDIRFAISHIGIGSLKHVLCLSESPHHLFSNSS